MTFPLNNLTDAIANVCPIDGVSIGNESVRASWRIDFKAAATAEQRAAAATVLASFDAEAPPEPDPQAPVLDLKAYAAAKPGYARRSAISNKIRRSASNGKRPTAAFSR